MDPRNLGERLEARESLDGIAGPLRDAVTKLLPRGAAKDALHGVWLGHPLHPPLTDLPIGFWTSSWVLDLVGGEKGQPAADALVGLGVATALPTAVSGFADWSELNTPERRSGLVHAGANIVATALYAASYVARRRQRRTAGVALGMAGAAAATIGGYLGGHLSYRRAAGMNQVAYAAAPGEWTKLEVELPSSDGELTSGRLEDTQIAAARVDGAVHALADRCSHLGGPLHEGELVDGCVRCPWHGSTFRLVDGTVVRGPATAPQPAYEICADGEQAQARRKPMP